MKRITYWALSTVSALVLLFGYHTSTSGASGTGSISAVAPISGGSTSSTSTSTSSGTNPPDDTTTSGTSSGSGSSSGSTTAKAKTVTGQVAQTRWGPVQVELTVKAKKVTNVSVVQYPNGNGRDAEINSRALPILIQETIEAQSANIDMVSGATVTSDGYVQSLQSALDQASL
ncbi:MAG: FMN-binding protein [Marmoricola sp.]